MPVVGEVRGRWSSSKNPWKDKLMLRALNPLTIDIALHYHAIPGDYGEVHGNFHAPAVQEAIQRLVRVGLLKCNHQPGPWLKTNINGTPAYEATEGLRVYIKALLSVPFPTPSRTWTMPPKEEW